MTHSSDNKRMSDGIRKKPREHVERLEPLKRAKAAEEPHYDLMPAPPILPEVYEEPLPPAVPEKKTTAIPEPSRTKMPYEEDVVIYERTPEKQNADAYANELFPERGEETFLEKFAKPKEPIEGRIMPAPRPALRERWGELTDVRRKRPLLWGTVGAAVIVCVLLLVVSTVFARVTVTVKPRVENVALEGVLAAFDMTAPKTLVAQKVIPAERQDYSKIISQEFPATDKRAVSEKARGRVKIYNAFSSASQSLVANTRFATESGTVYRISRGITIPGAKIEEGKVVPQFIEADLLADQPGAGGNAGGSLTLRVPGFSGTAKYNGFYAVAESGFSGGYVGEALVVSRDDISKAQEAVTKAAYDNLDAEVLKKAPPDFKVVSALREIQIKNVKAPNVGERRDTFTVEAEAVARVFLFRERDVLELLGALVLGENAAKDFVEGSAELQYRVRSVDFDKGKADISLHGSVKTKEKIMVEEIRGLVQGKKEGSILEQLKGRNEIATFSISFFPPWRYSAPSNVDKIGVVVEGPEAVPSTP